MEQFKAHEHNPGGDAEAIVNGWDQLNSELYTALGAFQQQEADIGSYLEEVGKDGKRADEREKQVDKGPERPGQNAGN